MRGTTAEQNFAAPPVPATLGLAVSLQLTVLPLSDPFAVLKNKSDGLNQNAAQAAVLSNRSDPGSFACRSSVHTDRQGLPSDDSYPDECCAGRRRHSSVGCSRIGIRVHALEQAHSEGNSWTRPYAGEGEGRRAMDYRRRL